MTYRVAIVGAGPSGFYLADSLIKSGLELSIDMYDRLLTPFGLLRGGVAPDHQKMKSVGAYYDRIMSKNRDKINFFGNIHVGTDISVEELQDIYDAVFFSYGAETDRSLGIPGEELQGSFSATEFVGWYNAHPDYADFKCDLSKEIVSIIGLGNVALDVARILAKTPDELASSDVPNHVLEQLANTKINRIQLIGRRGPVQAKYTPNELEEMGNLSDCSFHIDPNVLDLSATDREELTLEGKSKQNRNIELLNEFANRPLKKASKVMTLSFYLSPVEFCGSERTTSITFKKNKLTGPAGSQQLETTDETVSIKSDIVFRSIGYKGIAMPGVPFDEQKGVIPNNAGRILDNGVHVPGLYAAGWIKRGAVGVLGSNKPGAAETVACFIDDVATLKKKKTVAFDQIEPFLKAKKATVTTYDDWLKLDQEELKQGQKRGKPREKFYRTEEMLCFLNKI